MKKFFKRETITRLDFSDTLFHPHLTDFQADIIGANVVILEGSNPEEASIRVQWKEDSSYNYPSFYIKNNTLFLKSKHWKSFIGQKDPFIIEVTIPPYLSVKIRMLAGVLYLEHLHGDVNVVLRAGEIIGDFSSKNLTAKIWAGEMKMLFNTIPPDSKINLTCLLGDIYAKFPNNILIEQSVGKCKKNKIPNNVGADITARVMLGDVKIEE